MEKKFKKFFTAMLAVVLLATTMLVGCGENTLVNSTNTPATTTSTTFIYTVAPTDEITVEPTEEITETPAAEPTEDPTEEPTEEPTMEPTANPTEEPTESPTEKPTEAPTSKPTQTPDADVTFEDVDETVYAKRNLNVRSGPGTEYDKIGSLKYAKSVKRIGIGSNGWSKVIYNGKTAYCSSKYLSTSKPTSGGSSNISFPLTYSDSTCTITITREWYGASDTTGAWCYVAHLQFTDYSRFSTACANGRYNNGSETTSHAANRLGAIFAVNGCYSAPYLNYIVVRGGTICNGRNRNLWVPAVYSSRNGMLLNAWETGGTPGIAGHNVAELVEEGAVTDTFCFGPPILANGSITANSGGSRAQRTFIGTNGTPGDIWIVVTEGRKVDGVSAGLTYKECAKLLKSKGCTFGVPLDGGGSSTMVFQGKVLNHLQGGAERRIVDFVYFK